jgi:hypothetical protein
MTLLSALVTQSLRGQSLKMIDVSDPRPMASAIDSLEISIPGIPINYEDPPYENVADVQDVATAAQRLARPNFHLIVPRDGHVLAQVMVPNGAPSLAADTIFNLTQVLLHYRQGALPGDFKIEPANGMIYVTPVQILGANGVTRNVSSPMLITVWIPTAMRSVAEQATAILDAISRASGSKIVLGALPFWPTEQVTFGASGESARDALARLFMLVDGGPFSYRLLFDPRPDPKRSIDYMMNVQKTGYVSPQAPLTQDGSSSPQTAPVQGAQQPFKSGADGSSKQP